MPHAEPERATPGALQPLAASTLPRPRLGDQSKSLGMRSLLRLGALLCVLGSGCDEDGRPDAHVSREDGGSDRDANVRDGGLRGQADAGKGAGGTGDPGVPNYASCGVGFGRISLQSGSTQWFPNRSSAKRQGDMFATVESVEASSVRLRAGSVVYKIAAQGPVSFGIAIGETVKLHWDHLAGLSRAPNTRLSLHVGDRLAFSYTLGVALPPGFSVSPGAEQCRGEERCSRWVSEALIVRGPCGESVQVPSGERGRVCGYEVVPGDVRRTLERIGDQLLGCADWHELGTELVLSDTVQPRADDAGAPDAGQ